MASGWPSWRPQAYQIGMMMSKPLIAALTLGAVILVIVSVIVGLGLWAFGIGQAMRYSGLPEEDKINENIVLVEDSIEWKLISPSNDQFGNSARISFKFVVRNPTSKDIVVDAYDLNIRFFDAEGFALARYNYAEEFTVPANGEYTYSAPHSLQGGLGEQVAFVEVLGVRSK